MRLMILEGREKAREEFRRNEEKVLEGLRKIPSKRDYNASTSRPSTSKVNSTNSSNRSRDRPGFEPPYSSTPKKRDERTESRLRTNQRSSTPSRRMDWSSSGRRTSRESDDARGGRSKVGQQPARRSPPRLKSQVHIPRRVTRSMLD